VYAFFQQTNMLTYQILEHEIVEHLDVTLLCLFLFTIHPPPEGIDVPHIQHLVCIDLPCVATKQTA